MVFQDSSDPEMAPALVAAPDYSTLTQTEYRTKLDSKVDISLFPDGIKTTGQQPPLYELLRPYSAFPKQITGKTVWQREDYLGSPEKERHWKHPFTEEEINELSTVADRFLASGQPLNGISKVWENPR